MRFICDDKRSLLHFFIRLQRMSDVVLCNVTLKQSLYAVVKVCANDAQNKRKTDVDDTFNRHAHALVNSVPRSTLIQLHNVEIDVLLAIAPHRVDSNVRNV